MATERHERPRITVKYAQTLDGRIATASGHSRWVSGPQARVLAHRLRAEHDAVLVGVGTVIADNPRLSVRLCPGRDPLRVVVDSRFRIPSNATVLTDGSPTLVATTRAATAGLPEPTAAEVLTVRECQGRVDLQDLVQALYARQVRSLLVEGGPTIVTSFLRERLADEMVIVLAAKIIGAGIDAVGDLGMGEMDQAIQFADASFTTEGSDIVFRGRPVWLDA